MSRWITFISIIFFGKFSLVPEVPKHIQAETVSVVLSRPIMAITGGAALYVDISDMLPSGNIDVLSMRKWVQENIPDNCIGAVLHSMDGKDVYLKFGGKTSYDPDRSWLILNAAAGVPAWKKFGRLTVYSCMPMNTAGVYWKNYQD